MSGGRVDCLVEVGGVISSGKGVNLPGTPLPIPSLTEKDLADLEFALANGRRLRGAVVRAQRPTTCVDLRERIATAAVERADDRQDREGRGGRATWSDRGRGSDAVMVARGDLGVEIGVGRRAAGAEADHPRRPRRRPTVITATQMLESMINQPEPTRAEASDVANAVLDGTSALMLSGRDGGRAATRWRRWR